MARTEVTGSQIRDSSVSLTADVTGILPVVNGGTGSNTIALNNVMLGNGTGAVQTVAPGAAGNVLTSNGSTWTSGTAGPGVGSYPNVPAPASGRYLHPGGGAAVAGAISVGVLCFRKILVPANQTFDRIACEILVPGAGSVVRLGIYTCDVHGFPSTRVLDAGTVDASTAGVKEISISQALSAGVYCLAAVAQGAGCTIRAQQGTTNFFTSPLLAGEQMRGDGFNSAAATVPGALPANAQTDIAWGVVPGHVAPLMMLRAA